MKVGRGDEEGGQIGPLMNERGLDKVKAHVADALQKGGKLVCGGKQHEAGALFYEPTIITNMKPDMILKDEETFGPVAGLFGFKDEVDVIAQENDTRYGLASYFYSNDLGQCFRVAEALEYGMVGINEPLLATEVAPFGGIKESGHGRENSHYGMDDFVDIKYVLVGGIN